MVFINSTVKKMYWVLVAGVLATAGCDSATIIRNISGRYIFEQKGTNGTLYRNGAAKGGIKNQIYSWVKDVVSDDKFILAEQSVEPKWYFANLAFSLDIAYTRSVADSAGSEQAGSIEYWPGYTDSMNRHLVDSCYKLAEKNKITKWQPLDALAREIVENDPWHRKIFKQKLNFWIIDLHTDSLYGPLRRDDYLSMRKALGVADHLNLQDVQVK